LKLCFRGCSEIIEKNQRSIMTYASQGYAVISAMLSAPELALARELVARLVERHRSGESTVIAESVSVAAVTRQHPQRNPGLSADQWEHEPYIIGNLLALDARFASLFSTPTLWRWAGELLGCASEAVVFHLSNLTRKPAGNGPAIGWHRDARNTYCAAEDHRTLRFLLPLQPMSAVNGGTEIVAGSHLPGAAQTAEDSNLICCPAVAPGACLALHSEVLHGGAPNRGASERDVLVIQFGVASSILTCRADELLSLSGREAFLKVMGS
jgi:hypothetical protein